MSLISSVLKSLELFLQLKNNSFYYEIREKSRKRQKDIINEIEFTFTGEYRLKKIVIITRDCGNKRITFFTLTP